MAVWRDTNISGSCELWLTATPLPIHYFLFHFDTIVPVTFTNTAIVSCFVLWHHSLHNRRKPIRKHFIGCCYVSIRREQNMHFQPKMTYSRLRKNNSVKESKRSLQERARCVERGRSPEQSSTPLTEGVLSDGNVQPKGNKRHNPSPTSTVHIARSGRYSKGGKHWILNQIWFEISSVWAQVCLHSGFGPSPWAMLGLNVQSGPQCSWCSGQKFSFQPRAGCLGSLSSVLHVKHGDKRKWGRWFRTHRNLLQPQEASADAW